MRRVPELDGIRAIAAMVVVGLHAGNVSEAFRFPMMRLWGAMVVDLFFVLSGFLITAIILSEGRSRGFLANFYARRSLRTWPIYYLCLLAIAAAGVLVPGLYPIDGLPYYLTYTQNIPHYWDAEAPPFCLAFAHAWSLGVEEQFYLIWPALVLLAGRRRLVPLALGVAALAFASRAWWRLDSQLLLTRCDGLALGSLLAAVLADQDAESVRSPGLIHHLGTSDGGISRSFAFRVDGVRGRTPVFRAGTRIAADRNPSHPDEVDRLPGLTRAFIGLIVGSLAYLVPITLFFLGVLPNPWGLEPGTSGLLFSVNLLTFNLLFTGLVGLVVCRSEHPSLGFLRGPLLGYLGRISYGIYLYHGLVFGLVHRLYGGNLPAWVVLAAISATVALAALSWVYVERPVLGLKRRLAYRSPASRQPPPSPRRRVLETSRVA